MPAFTSTVVVHEKFVVDDPKAVCQCVNEFLGGDYEFVNPLEEFWRHDMTERRHDRFAWVLWAEQGEKRWLLDYFTCYEPTFNVVAVGFMHWLKEFKPINCNDWLLASSLYSRSLLFDESPDWSRILSVQSQTIKRVLAPSRGLLAWDAQYRQLVYLANKDATKQQVDELLRGYNLRKNVTLDLLENMRIDGISLKKIFDKRGYSLGVPNFHLSGFLSEFISLAP